MNDEMESFLRNELMDLCRTVEGEDIKAYAFCITICSVDGISEKFLHEIMLPCCFNEEEINLHLSCFLGMELLNLRCACLTNEKCYLFHLTNQPGFLLGRKFLHLESAEYKDAERRIENLKLELQHI